MHNLKKIIGKPTHWFTTFGYSLLQDSMEPFKINKNLRYFCSYKFWKTMERWSDGATVKNHSIAHNANVVTIFSHADWLIFIVYFGTDTLITLSRTSSKRLFARKERTAGSQTAQTTFRNSKQKCRNGISVSITNLYSIRKFFKTRWIITEFSPFASDPDEYFEKGKMKRFHSSSWPSNFE